MNHGEFVSSFRKYFILTWAKYELIMSDSLIIQPIPEN